LEWEGKYYNINMIFYVPIYALVFRLSVSLEFLFPKQRNVKEDREWEENSNRAESFHKASASSGIKNLFSCLATGSSTIFLCKSSKMSGQNLSR
jgi:hypothetical protein